MSARRSDGRLPTGCLVGGWATVGFGVFVLIAGGVALSSCDDELDFGGGDACERTETPLVDAAIHGTLDEIEDELADGVDPDDRSDGGATALRCAAERGNVRIVEALLEAGADPDLRDVSGDTALLWAAQNDHPEVVHLLLEADADPTIATDEGHRPLLRAAFEGHVDVVRLLLDGGADPEAAGRLRPSDTRTGADVLGCALVGGPAAVDSPSTTLEIEEDRDDLRRCVRRTERAYPSVPAGPAEEVPALFAAALNDQPAVVQVLVDRGAAVDPVAFEAYTPLYLAAAEGNEDVVRVLLDAGADPAWRSPLTGFTAAEAAFAIGHADVVRLLQPVG